MSRALLLSICLLLLFPLQTHASDKKLKNEIRLKGWGHSYQVLVDAGADKIRLAKLFRDKRMPKLKKVYFKVEPKEPEDIYRARNTKKERLNALRFYKEHIPHFKAAEKKYLVPQSVLLTILQIETKCGGFTGKRRIFHRLARLISTSDPKVMKKNLKKQQKEIDESITFKQIQNRASWLTKTFLPHMLAVLDVADHMNTHPLELKGSSSGALGMPQFLPGNYFRYGVDGDQNGKINLFSPQDAIYSTARFLNAHGWNKKKLPLKAQKAALWNYNRSEPYIKTILLMAQRLKEPMRKIENKKKEFFQLSPL